MVSTYTASLCSCNCPLWKEQKHNVNTYIYDLAGLLVIIMFALIMLLSKAKWIITYMLGWSYAIFNSFIVKIVHLLWHWIPSDISGHPIRAKCCQYRRLCELWIDYSELFCYLYQVDELNPVLLDYWHGFDNHSSNKYKSILTTSLFDYLDSLPQGYEMFINCLKMSTEKADGHPGHYSLLELLTSDDTALLESAEYRHNLVIREIIRVNLPGFVTMTDVNQLLPLLEKRQLLTDNDKDIFKSMMTTSYNKARYLLTDFLYTKGHQGYIRYFECLQEEASHIGHHSILKVITKSLRDQQICVPEVCVHRGVRTWLNAKGILGTKEYYIANEELTFGCLSDDGIKLDQNISTFIEFHGNVPEAKAVGSLLKGFRFKLLGEFNELRNLKTDIELYISNMANIENKKLIRGKWLLLLSCLKRYEKKFQEARALLDQAKAELFFVASGDDLAHVYYTEASLFIEENGCSALKEDKYKQVITLLHNSIKCSPSSSRGISVRQARCHLKLALCHMGSSLNYSCITQNQSQLEKAKSSLTMLERQFESLPLLLKMQYFTVNCDYCRGIGEKYQALKSIQEGLILDPEKRFKVDLEHLNVRK